MNRKLLICVWALSVVVLGSGKSLACDCEDPDADMTTEPSDNGSVVYVCVGEEITFDGSGSSDPDWEEGDCDKTLDGIITFEWDFGDTQSYSEDYDNHTDGDFDGKTKHSYSNAGAYTVTLTVYDDDDDCCCSTGPPDCVDKSDQTTVDIIVMEIELFTDSSYSQALDDWPEGVGELRSAKYIFGSGDPIYVRVKDVGTDPLVAETLTDCVKVTSDSDSTGISLTLKETGTNTQIFNNSESSDLFYLSTSNSSDKIKVVDEEVLTFATPEGTSCKDVMVDRGEVAAVDGTSSDDAAEIYGDLSSSPYNYFGNGLYDEDSGNKAQGTGAKCVSLGVSTDFLNVSGHGLTTTPRINGDSGFGLNTDTFIPNDISGWTRELDWVLFAVCSQVRVLDPVDAPSGNGVDWIKKMPNVHCLLGYASTAPTGGTDVNVANKFLELAQSNTVYKAWLDANIFYSQVNARCIVNENNLSDTFEEVTRDKTTNKYKYYKITGSTYTAYSFTLPSP